ncbi:MAG TPA: DMT family transporter [Stenomitos sp.]
MTTLSLILVAALWGGFFVVGTLSVHHAAPLAVGAWRFLLATPLFFALYLPRRRMEVRPTRRDWLVLAGMGATGVFGYNWISFEAMQRASAADGAMITPALHPLLTLFLAGLLFGESVTLARLLGLAVAILGEGLVFHEAIATFATHPDRLVGDLLYLAAAVCWSCYTLLGRAASRRLSPLATSAYSSAIGTLMLVPVGGSELLRVPFTWQAWPFWAGVAYLSVGGTVVAFWLWHRGIAKVGASRAASFSYLVPVFALGLSVLMLHERPSPLQLLGTSLVLAGVVLANAGTWGRMPGGWRIMQANVRTGEEAS